MFLKHMIFIKLFFVNYLYTKTTILKHLKLFKLQIIVLVVKVNYFDFKLIYTNYKTL